MTPVNPVDSLPKDLLLGRNVFITGGGSGINLGIAKSFASVGANVAICGRTRARLETAAVELRALGVEVSISAADVRDADALEAAFETTREELGPVDTVVAGAAGNFFAPAESISSNGFRTVLDIDLLGSFHTAQSAFAQLKETGGNLLFISAGQSYLPFAHQAHVGAAKAGVDNLMRNLALEWGQYGIRANSIVPGPIEGTEGMERLTGPVGEDVWTRAVPLGRFGTVEEIGAMAVVLSSPLGSYVTGAQIVVDGGLGLSGLGSLSQAVVAALPAGESNRK
ncbi:MAG: SDR family oxidoreductase [Rhodococcus sp. (in: high G+C Gram-positive bacteria)]|uniref:SDR family oxidoreductase n=1 Tax=Rhodococcus sp. TaxID=1831 RepID=UPI003BAEE61B